MATIPSPPGTDSNYPELTTDEQQPSGAHQETGIIQSPQASRAQQDVTISIQSPPGSNSNNPDYYPKEFDQKSYNQRKKSVAYGMKTCWIPVGKW